MLARTSTYLQRMGRAQGEAMTRDYIAEALAIAEGRSILRAQREHLIALCGVMNKAFPYGWANLHKDHPYPQPEPEAEFERRTRG